MSAYKLRFLRYRAKGSTGRLAAILLVGLLPTAPVRAESKEAQALPPRPTRSERLAERLKRADPKVRMGDSASPSLEPRMVSLTGTDDPALFFPWEVTERLAQSAFHSNLEYREVFRLQVQSRARQAGVSLIPWNDLEETLAGYLRFKRQQEASLISIEEKPAKERESVLESLRSAGHEGCWLRAQALSAARERFGDVEFETYLYLVVAPDMFIVTPVETEIEERHSFIERGCR